MRFVRVRVFRVFGFFARDGRARGKRRCAYGFECFTRGGGVSGRVVNSGNSGGGVEAALAADIALDFLLGPPPLVKFLGVGVVPPREPDLCGRAVRGGVVVRVQVQ